MRNFDCVNKKLRFVRAVKKELYEGQGPIDPDIREIMNADIINVLESHCNNPGQCSHTDTCRLEELLN